MLSSINAPVNRYLSPQNPPKIDQTQSRKELATLLGNPSSRKDAETL